MFRVTPGISDRPTRITVLAEAVTFSTGDVVVILLFIAAFFVAALVWLILVVRAGYRFGSLPSSRRRVLLWLLFSAPAWIYAIGVPFRGDWVDAAWSGASFAPVLLPPAIGWLIRGRHVTDQADSGVEGA